MKGENLIELPWRKVPLELTSGDAVNASPFIIIMERVSGDPWDMSGVNPDPPRRGEGGHRPDEG